MSGKVMSICRPRPLFVVLLLLTAATACSSVATVPVVEGHSIPTAEEEPAVHRFQQWMAAHGRSYSTRGEMISRLGTYSTNVKYIDDFNREAVATGRTYELGEGPFTDLTDEEFAARFLSTTGASAPLVTAAAGSLEAHVVVADDVGPADLPASVDWRQAGAVTAVRDQEFCGACKSTLLSDHAARLSGFTLVDPYNEDSLMAAVAKQPVVVSIAPSGSDLRHYKTGVFNGPCGAAVSHDITLVGYGQDPSGTPYWIGKNSWGAGWGEAGFIFMRRDVKSQPWGLCGLAVRPVYPLA